MIKDNFYYLALKRIISLKLAMMTIYLSTSNAYGKDSLFKCPPVIAPIIVIGGNKYYKKDSVTIDIDLQNKNKYSLMKVYDFLNRISDLSDKFVNTKIPNYKICADDQILTWAKSNSLSKFGSNTNTGDFQSNYVQQWAIATLGLVRIKLGPLYNDIDDTIVRNWMRKGAFSVRDFHMNINYHNNHYNWAILGVGSVGFSINDDHLINSAKKMFHVAIAEIQPDGILPLEIKRKERASSYHSMAAQPLAVYQLLRSQCANDTERPEKLLRLINLVKEIRERPQLLRYQAKAVQLSLGKQPWIHVWDTVNAKVSREKPSASRYISGTSGALSKVLIESCPAIS